MPRRPPPPGTLQQHCSRLPRRANGRCQAHADLDRTLEDAQRLRDRQMLFLQDGFAPLEAVALMADGPIPGRPPPRTEDEVETSKSRLISIRAAAACLADDHPLIEAVRRATEEHARFTLGVHARALIHKDLGDEPIPTAPVSFAEAVSRDFHPRPRPFTKEETDAISRMADRILADAGVAPTLTGESPNDHPAREGGA